MGDSLHPHSVAPIPHPHSPLPLLLPTSPAIMSLRGRLASPLLALAVGVGSGVWIFKPLLESYKASTQGTFLPSDDTHSAPVPPLPMTSLQPAKTKDGKDLLPPPAQVGELPEAVREVQEPRREV